MEQEEDRCADGLRQGDGTRAVAPVEQAPVALDDRGVLLESSIEMDGDILRLSIDDSTASYPMTARCAASASI